MHTGLIKGLQGDAYDAPTAEIYAKLVKAASDAIKKEDSGAWINSGCMGQDPTWQYVGWKGQYTWDRRYLTALKGIDADAADSVSYQRYDSFMRFGPEGKDLMGVALYGRKLLDEIGIDKKLWITECGYPARERKLNLTGEDAYRNTNYQKQAEYISRLLALYASDEKVDKLLLYEMQDDREDPFSSEENYGLIHSAFYRTPWAAKPSYIAVAAFNSIAGKTVKSESLGAEVKYSEDYTEYYKFHPIIYKLTDDAGRETLCVWSTGEEELCTVSTGKAYAVVYDMYGNAVEEALGGTVTLTASEDMKYVVGYDSAEIYAEKSGRRLTDIKSIFDGDEIFIKYMQQNDYHYDPKVIRKTHDEVMSALYSLSVPVHTCIGNHDNALGNCTDERKDNRKYVILPDEMHRRCMKYNPTENNYYYIDLPNDNFRFVFLDVSDGDYRQDKNGRYQGWMYDISDKQAIWFSNEALKTDRNIIVFCHGPICNSSIYGMTDLPRCRSF